MPKRVALTVESMNGLESTIDPRFGRAYAYVVVDVDTCTLAAQLGNAMRKAAHSAGTEAAAVMAGNSVVAVISGRFGRKSFQALGNIGIEMWTAPRGITVKEAVTRFVAGRLRRETTPSDGGRGMGRCEVEVRTNEVT